MMKTYTVTIPIAGHIIIDVDAENAKDAINIALESDNLTLDHCEEWTVLEQFTSGNVCYCPSPWQATAEPAFGEDPDDGD